MSAGAAVRAYRIGESNRTSQAVTVRRHSSSSSALATPFAPDMWALRINCGGPSYTDSLNQVWVADTHFSGGLVYDFVPVAWRTI